MRTECIPRAVFHALRNAQTMLGLGPVIKYRLLCVCHDRALESHILEVTNSCFRLVVGFSSAELFVEG